MYDACSLLLFLNLVRLSTAPAASLIFCPMSVTPLSRLLLIWVPQCAETVWCYDSRLSAVNVRSGIFHYSAVIVLNEVCAIVAEIACVQIGIFEVVYLQVPRNCLLEFGVLFVSSYNLTRHSNITTS